MAIFHNIFDDFVQHQRLQTSQRRAQRPGDHSPRPRHRPKSRYHGVLALPNRQPTSHPGGQPPQRDQRKAGRNHHRHPPANGFYGLIQRPPLQQPQQQQQSNQSTMTQVFQRPLEFERVECAKIVNRTNRFRRASIVKFTAMATAATHSPPRTR